MTRGSFDTVATSPSAKTAPLTSTVTVFAKLKTRSMSCSMSRIETSAGKRVDGLEDLLALAFGNAGDRLVEQQHARPAGERGRDLEQAPLAVGERVDRLVHHVGEAKARQQRLAFGGDRGVAAERPPPSRARPLVNRHRERERRQRRQRVEELVDLERADDAAAHAPMRGERRDVVAVERDRPRGRLEHAGEQVDQRRLAGAVRADQGVARAALDAERDVVGRRQAAEALDQRARLGERSS